MKYTLSFCILDDLTVCHGPEHRELNGIPNFNDIKEVILNDLLNDFRQDEYADCSGYFDKEFFASNEYIDTIVNNLIKYNYVVKNRYNKYYVIAFAINYTRFEVYSKDCDKELIKWRENDSNDPIKGIITNPNYNENPVVTAVALFSSIYS
jgi:hypothetical protein